MTDKPAEKTPDDSLPPGFTDVSGPAAFKARQPLPEDEPASEDAEPGIDSRIAGLENVLAQSNDQLLRTVAELENLRKRSQREREDASRYAVASFARDLLDVADNFRRALESIPEGLRGDEKIKPLVDGIEATERALLKSFEKNGIRKMEPLDEVFNPNFHEVMFEAPVPGKAPGTIIQLVEVGYMLHDRLLRAARVGVAKGDGRAPPLHQVDTQA